MGRRRFDVLALAASCLTVVMLVVYVATIRAQGDDPPLVWFEVALVVGSALAAYGVYRPAPHRKVALLVAAAILGACGLLGLLTIGAPILLAGVLCLLAALLERPVRA